MSRKDVHIVFAEGPTFRGGQALDEHVRKDRLDAVRGVRLGYDDLSLSTRLANTRCLADV